jgi:pimeloyl-ACP methyl ester carboxylesterase
MGRDLDAWRAQGARYTHRGHSVFVRRAHSGRDGRALLCVHGLPTASWDFARIWPGLSASFGSVLAPDLLGFGFSDKPRDYTYAIADQADLCEALLRSEGISRASVLAHDYGVTVAQELLARSEARLRTGAPGLVLERVAFLNGGLFPESHRPLLIQRLMLTPLGPLLAQGMTRALFARSFCKVFGPRTQPSEAELDDFWSLVVHAGGRNVFHRLFHYIPERRAQRERWVGALCTSSVPLRLVNGPEDSVSGAHLAARYRELVPFADVVSLPGIGHYPHVEAPEATLAAIAPFFSGARA